MRNNKLSDFVLEMLTNSSENSFELSSISAESGMPVIPRVFQEDEIQPLLNNTGKIKIIIRKKAK